MSGAAEIRLAGRTGMFVADSATIEAGVVSAEGRWRTRGGANNSTLKWSEARAYTWPVAQVVEVRWAVVA